ncbi:MAG: DegV family protein [Oscillospiraceae bacterium]
MKIKITADSTCDLSPELIEKYDIGIFPLSVMLKDKPLRDGIDVTPQDIFDNVAAGGNIGSTMAVNVADYLDRFSEYRKEYDAVIHFTISSEMSACFQNANIAAADLTEVYVIDSRNLSTGIGHLVLDAAIKASEGMEASAIKEYLDKKKELLDVSFVLDTLDYLRRGGRCSALAALGANLLSLKPCIEVKGGKMGVGKKYRGSVEKSILKYVSDRLMGQSDIDYSRIFITESGDFDDEFLASVEAQVRACGPFNEIIHTRAGCTVSNHCGPKTLGVLFYRTSEKI